MAVGVDLAYQSTVGPSGVYGPVTSQASSGGAASLPVDNFAKVALYGALALLAVVVISKAVK